MTWRVTKLSYGDLRIQQRLSGRGMSRLPANFDSNQTLTSLIIIIISSSPRSQKFKLRPAHCAAVHFGFTVCNGEGGDVCARGHRQTGSKKRWSQLGGFWERKAACCFESNTFLIHLAHSLTSSFILTHSIMPVTAGVSILIRHTIFHCYDCSAVTNLGSIFWGTFHGRNTCTSVRGKGAGVVMLIKIKVVCFHYDHTVVWGVPTSPDIHLGTLHHMIWCWCLKLPLIT